MPGLLDPTHPHYTLLQKLKRDHPGASAQEIRLWAVGMDAYRLSINWDRITKFPNLGYVAATGTLFLTPHNTITRSLQWATMVSGVPTLF